MILNQRLWVILLWHLPSIVCYSTWMVQNQRPASSCLLAQREATFGMGCFWKPSEELLKVDGVSDTIVGYTGVPNYVGEPPTYDRVCYSRNWVEGIRVIYDDQQITYPDLLNKVFDLHEAKLGSRQYASIIFPHDKEQTKEAMVWLQENLETVRSSDGFPARVTKIEPQSIFFRAENYHQQYWQKTRPRIVCLLLLLSISTGILDKITPVEMQQIIHTTGNALSLVGLVLIVVERKLDTRVVEI